MSATPDDISRLGVTTRTANSHFDEVLAITQAAINKNFANLFNIYPELQTYKYSNKAIGNFTAEFLAPTVVIPPGDNNILYFQLRFKSGKIINSNNDLLVDDMSDWIFTVQCEIDKKPVSMFHDGDDDLSPSELAAAKKKRQAEIDQINDQYVFASDDVSPGDYSIERLYARLSTAKWGRPIDDYSQAGIDKNSHQPISLTRWMGQKSQSMTGTLLEFFLTAWARDMDASGWNCIGLIFKLPDRPKNDTKATYEPTDAMQQTYPYKEIQNGKLVNPTDDPNGIVQGHSKSCLLYCEMVQNHSLPPDTKVIWSGNFAPEDYSKDGTFLMSHDIFVRDYLLKQFQAMNQASEIMHDQSGQGFRQSDGNGVEYLIPYSIGGNSQHPNPLDDYYAFQPVFDGGSTYKVQSYAWKQEHGPWTTSVQSFDSCDTKGTVHDVNTTTVTWTPGSPEITIRGCSVTYEHGLWTGRYTRTDWEHPYSEMNDKYDVDWHVTLRVKKLDDNDDVKGALTVEVDTGPNDDCYCTVTPTLSHNKVDMKGHDTEMKDALIKKIKGSLETIAKNAASRLKGAGKFVYPGNGTLAFSNPQFGKWGDLIADVTYLPLQPGDFITIPGPHEDDPGDNGDPIIDNPRGEQPPPDELQLTWDITKQLKANSQDNLVFKITNDKDVPWYLDTLRVFFTSGSKGMDIFTADPFKLGDTSGKPDENETSAQASAKKKPPREDPEDSSTSATLEYSKDITTIPRVDVQKAKDGEVTELTGDYDAWVAIISTVDPEQLFTLPPKATMTLSLNGPTCKPGNRNVVVHEFWKCQHGDEFKGHAERFTVRVRA